MLICFMRLSFLKESFLAAMPVIGPHAHIESELMLAGEKPLTWIFVFPDTADFSHPEVKNIYKAQKKLDQAVLEGRLISQDVEQRDPENSAPANIIRHYAQPKNREDLKKVAAFNSKAFNREDLSDVMLDKDLGHYLGYRKRDIYFFNYIVNSAVLPDALVTSLIEMNAPCQKALQNKLLNQSAPKQKI